MKYEHRTYGVEFKVSQEAIDRDVVVVNPGWFARVFLRRKPKRISLLDAAKERATAARENEEAMIRNVFEDGKLK